MRPNKNICIFLTLAVLIVCTNCTKESHSEKNINMIDYTDELSNWDWEKIEPNQLYVIHSIDEYAQYMKRKDDQAIDIDFEKYTLLVVKDQANKGINEVFGKIICSETDYILEIIITLDDTQIMEKWHLGLLAPTIPINKKIDLEMKYQ